MQIFLRFLPIYLYISKKNLTFAPDLGASALHASTYAHEKTLKLKRTII